MTPARFALIAWLAYEATGVVAVAWFAPALVHLSRAEFLTDVAVGGIAVWTGWQLAKRADRDGVIWQAMIETAQGDISV